MDNLDDINGLSTLDAINKIDEKLAELKLTKKSPNYNKLFRRFSWSRKWFNAIEDVLLTLAFRGENDQPVLDFIRTKIRETDVITFNKTFIPLHNLNPIRNHYEVIIGTKNETLNILYSENNAIIDAALDYYIDIHSIPDWNLNRCNNDRVVEYLIANPEKICIDTFSLNKNAKAAKYCISVGQIRPAILSQINDDYIVDYLLNNPKPNYIDNFWFAQNPNDKVVSYLLNSPIKSRYLSYNNNDRVVDYLIANPQYISWRCFSANTNEKAIDYLLANPDKICESQFFHIKNKKVVDYMIPKLNNIDPSILAHHADDRIIDYLLNNASENAYDMYEHIFCYPNNHRTIEHILNIGKGSAYATYLQDNIYDYYDQKLEAFNAAGMFPRIPDLTL